MTRPTPEPLPPSGAAAGATRREVLVGATAAASLAAIAAVAAVTLEPPSTAYDPARGEPFDDGTWFDDGTGWVD